MRLVVFYILASLALFICSCAQVGRVSGGEQDVFAPRLISEKCSPKNESINYREQSIELVFDEYFKLKDPRANITMVPKHATLKTEIKKKSLIISWPDTLEENTTYAIYFNNAIADITEGNDSIMQFVFSTGSYIDSISYMISVIDAWTLTPTEGCVVALIDTASNEVMNFTETNRSGFAKLKYVPKGNYRLLAFKDENKDLTLQKEEVVGFPLQPDISITETSVDSVPVKLFKSNLKSIINRVAPISGHKLSVLGNVDLSKGKWSINDEPLIEENIRRVRADSIVMILDNHLEKRNELVFSDGIVDDTLAFTNNLPKGPDSPQLKPLTKGIYNSSDQIVFELDRSIEELDVNKIKLVNKLDSTWSGQFQVDYHLDLLTLALDPSLRGAFELTLLKGAISSINEIEKTILPFEIKEDNKFGVLNVELSKYTSPIVLLVYHNGKLTKNLAVKNPRNVKIPFLNPGNYSFKVVLDVNQNGRWDVGNYSTLEQPETIHNYSTKTKLRANWEANVELDPALIKN